MATITFDTLKFVERLRASGVPEGQAKAEALAGAFSEALDTHLATGSDIARLERGLLVLKWMAPRRSAALSLSSSRPSSSPVTMGAALLLALLLAALPARAGMEFSCPRVPTPMLPPDLCIMSDVEWFVLPEAKKAKCPEFVFYRCWEDQYSVLRYITLDKRIWNLVAMRDGLLRVVPLSTWKDSPFSHPSSR